MLLASACVVLICAARESKISNSQPATHTDTYTHTCMHPCFVPVHPETCVQSWCKFLVERFCLVHMHASHVRRMRALWSTFIQMSRTCSEKIHLTKSCEGKGGNILFDMHVLRGRTVHATFLFQEHENHAEKTQRFILVRANSVPTSSS